MNKQSYMSSNRFQKKFYAKDFTGKIVDILPEKRYNI